MKQIPENKAREERIPGEVIVDCYGSEEVLMGWLTYLQDSLACPFERLFLKYAERTDYTVKHGFFQGFFRENP